jgi:hypothetical protein
VNEVLYLYVVCRINVCPDLQHGKGVSDR